MEKRFKISRNLPPVSVPERKKSLASAFLGAFLIALVLLLAMASFLGCQPTSPQTAAPIVTNVQSPGLIPPKDYGTWNATLTEAIANLNRAELKFIRDAKAASFLPARMPGLASPLGQGDLLDDDLVDVAVGAMNTAQTANNLGKSAAAQDKGSDNAAQVADKYNAAARTAYALVIEAQNLREGLQKRATTPANAVPIIAGYGARMYNVASSQGKDNPFTGIVGAEAESKTLALSTTAVSALKNSSGAALPQSWIATADMSTTRKIDVPAPRTPIANPLDPGLVPALTTKAGQQQGDTARQVALANLNSLGAKVSPGSANNSSTQVEVSFKPLAVAGKDQIAAGNVPSFNKGSASSFKQNDASSTDQFVNTLLNLNGENPPTKTADVPVTNSQPVVALTISKLVIAQVNKRSKDAGGTFEADVVYGFDVQWQANVTTPQFDMDCVSGNHFEITTAAGSKHINAKGLLLLYPGVEDAFCYASHNGNTWGSASVHFLVGDSTEATARVHQVETDAASLDATLTAEAVGTKNKEGTLTAVAASQTAVAARTINALETEVAADKTAEFKKTAAEFATRQALPPPTTTTPSTTPTFAPKVVDTLTHPGNIDAVTTKVVLQRGRLYRFTFSGRVNVINPPRSLSAGQLPDRVNGIAVPPSGVLVVEGTGGVATITCGHEIPDPKNPGAYGIVVEDLGPS